MTSPSLTVASPGVPGSPGRPGVWAPPSWARDALKPYAYRQWELLGQGLHQFAIARTSSTTALPVEAWAEQVNAALHEQADGSLPWEDPSKGQWCPLWERDAIAVIACGVAPEDLFAFSFACQRLMRIVPEPTAGTGALLWTAGRQLSGYAVRDVIGWLLAGAAAGDENVYDVERRAHQWALRGMPGGWAHVAAGLSLDEARFVDVGQARLLAGLREVTLPVG